MDREARNGAEQQRELMRLKDTVTNLTHKYDELEKVYNVSSLELKEAKVRSIVNHAKSYLYRGKMNLLNNPLLKSRKNYIFANDGFQSGKKKNMKWRRK